jgi:hypothetical protein
MEEESRWKGILAYVLSWSVAAVVAAALWSSYRWWVAILIGLASGFPVFVLVAWWAARDGED